MAAPENIQKSIVDDTGWTSKKSGSYVVDYERVVKFNRELTDAEMDSVMTWVRTELFPGWSATPTVTARREPGKTGAWRFESTVDSS